MWGDNTYGQSLINYMYPTEVSQLYGLTKAWIKFSLGGWHSLGLTSEGTIYGWGYNQDGRKLMNIL
jgi:alpha-tubulin suppressor-like RCC1 family protein